MVRQFAACAMCLLAAGAGWGETVRWTGGAGDDLWSTAGNWSGGAVPGAADVVVFDDAATVNFSGDWSVAGFVFNAAVTVTTGEDAEAAKSSTNRIRLGDGAGQATITVADDVAVSFNVRLFAAEKNKTRLVKDGGGEIAFLQYVGRDCPFDGFALDAGTVRFGFPAHSDGASFGSGVKIVVQDGATLHIGDNNQVSNFTVFDVRAGGLVDFGNYADVIGGFVGEGVVTNIGSASLTFQNGPLLFAGRAYGTIRPHDTLASGDPAMVVGAADAFAGITWTTGSNGLPTLRFAPGVGTFTLKRYIDAAEASLELADTAGRPVTLRTGLDSVLKGRVTGAGSLVKTDTADYQTVVTGDRLELTGDVGRSGGRALVFGDGATADSDVDFSHFNALVNGGPGEYMGFANVADLTLGLPVYGDGAFRNLGPGRVTFANLLATNAAIVATATATAPTDVAGGDWRNLLVDQQVCATNTISGGRGDGLHLRPSRAGGVINVTGGVFTNVVLDTSGSAADSESAINILGGELYVTNRVLGYGRRSYTIDGAQVTLANGFSAGGGGLYEMFTITNGATVTFGAAATWNQGLGFSVSDRSTVTLKRTGYYNYRIASDGTPHRWFVGDGGRVVSDSLVICSPGNAGMTTGTLEIARGGRFTLADGGISTPGTDNGYGEVVLDGGVLEYAFSTASSAIMDSATREEIAVTERGGTIETALVRPDYKGCLKTRILPRTADGAVDGGLTKLGVGSLLLDTALENELRGPFRILEGHVYAYAPHPFGYGDVHLAHAYVSCDVLANGVQRIADGAESRVYVSGAPFYFLRCNADEKATLVMGPADAGEDAVLAGETPNALLFFRSGDTGETFDGTGVRVLVNGGVSLTPAGLSSFPAMALAALSTNDRGSLRFLSYDAERGFVAAPLTEGLAGGETSVANVEEAPLTVAEDTHVGALRVHAQNDVAALTIAAGATLRVGDGANPAQVILNNANTKNKTAQIDGAGTLDFGTSLGVIAVNWARSNLEDAEVKATIAGSGGLSLAGVARYYPSLIALGAANVYTGGTYIDGVQVTVSNDRALGTGDVHVQGSRAYGGGLLINTATLANNLHVRGCGMLRYQQSTQGEGALVFARSATLSGDIEIVDFATFVSKNSLFEHALTGRISGGDLSFEGSGAFTLGQDNALTGTVSVAGCCTLRVSTGGALGTGPVENGGTIEFVNESDITVANELRGTGRIVLAGAGKVTFTAAAGFAGVVTMDASGRTLDVGAGTMGAGTISGNGVVTGSAGGVLELAGSATGSDFGGVVSGGLSLVKTGAGTQYLSGGNTYAGTTEVREGTLVLGARPFSDALAVRDALFQLDASDASTLEVDADGRVTKWSDALGGARAFTNVAGYAAFPTRRMDAVNGRSSVWFDGDRGGLNSALFSETPATGVRTVFGVFRTSAETHPNNWNCAGFFGAHKADKGLRLNGATRFNAGNNWTENTAYRINGVLGNDFVAATATVWSVELASAQSSTTGLAVGDYWSNANYLRCILGDFCELIAYDRVLTVTETEEVTTYLEKKWRNRPDPTGVTVDVLPAGTALLVEAAGVLDLAGVSQTVATLAGSGAVVDSKGGAVLTVTDSLSGFTGTLAGLTLAVPAGTTLALDPRATVSPDCSLRLGDHAVLDLGGRTVTVLNASGTGRVVNGTLVVTGRDARHGLGTILLVR
ncbi:MAG: autotransporter-associated beta strand repeat-containing protein [Kiritimatiellia bacterium]